MKRLTEKERPPTMTSPFYYPRSLADLVGDLTYWRGAACKYIVRAGRKDGSTFHADFDKAIECIERERERMHNEQARTALSSPAARNRRSKK